MLSQLRWLTHEGAEFLRTHDPGSSSVPRGREERAFTLKVRVDETAILESPLYRHSPASVPVLRYAAQELKLPTRAFMNICLDVNGVATRTSCCAINCPGAADLG